MILVCPLAFPPRGSEPVPGFIIFLNLSGRDPHGADLVADHVGGASRPYASGINGCPSTPDGQLLLTPSNPPSRENFKLRHYPEGERPTQRVSVLARHGDQEEPLVTRCAPGTTLHWSQGRGS